MQLDLEFTGTIFEWRGPAPFFYVAVPPAESEDIHDLSAMLTYGWGCIPVTVRVGATQWSTSLFPKDGRYLVPIKLAVRRAEGLTDGDTVSLRLRAGDADT